MKYWLLTTEFPPIHGGGISTYCLETVKMFSAMGHEVKVFINDHSVKDVEEEKHSAYTLVRFQPNRGKVSDYLGWESKLAYAFCEVLELSIKKEGQPDFIEAQDYLGIGYFVQQKSWLNYPAFKGIPILITMHAPSFLYLEYNQSPYYRLPAYFTGEMEKASMAMADLLISPSQYLIDALKKEGVIHLENAKHLFNPYSVSENIAEDFKEGELVFFGKMTPQKGCLELFAYLKRMWDEGFDLPIRIVGEGNHFFYPQQMDMQDYLTSKYKQYIDAGLIIFEGKIPPAKLEKYLASAHLVIVPSIIDNLPYAVIEAMAYGKVVLASDAGGHRELIRPGENGFLFSHEDDDFSSVLSNILELPKEKILEVGSKARKTISTELDHGKIYELKMQLLKSIPSRASVFPFSRAIPNTEKSISLEGKRKLSVVIPFFNLFGTLTDTLESLKKSDYTDLEVIVVNDGSTDQEAEKRLQDLQKDYNFELYHKSNTGLSESRNFGAEKAKGDFLAFLDADDTVDPTYYSKAIDVLISYDNLHFVGCWAQYFGENESIWPSFNPEPPYLLYHNMINSSALVYKKDSFLKFGRNKKKMIYGMEDYESVINMVESGARGVVLPVVLWNYRIRKNSMQQSFNRNKQLYLYGLISAEHSGFYSMYGAELSKLYNHNGPSYNIENPTLGPKGRSRLELLLPPKILQLVKHNVFLRRMGKLVYKRLNKI